MNLENYKDNIAIGVGLLGAGLSAYGMADGFFEDEFFGDAFTNATVGAYIIVGSYFYSSGRILNKIRKDENNKLEEKLE
ncbi:MAG: hypothetical protein WDZ62_01215 [Candidatus Pacearchaeota archaeon]